MNNLWSANQLIGYLLISFYLIVFPNNTYSQSEPGSVAANAIALELTERDKLGDFHNSRAVIQKGNAFGVIDPSGKLIVPFQKYQRIDEFSNGYAIASVGDRKSVLIDKSGKEINTLGFSPLGKVDDDGYIQVNETYGIVTIVNIKTGKKYSNREAIATASKTGLSGIYYVNDFHYGLAVVESKEKKFGFVDRNFKLKIPAKYTYAAPFSDGLAVVGQKNEFGEERYGYIDVNGKVVIPFNFTNRPGSFYKNRAYVLPKDVSQFRYGFIDKTGELKIKLNDYVVTPEFKEDVILITHRNAGGTFYFVDTMGVETPVPKKLIFSNNEYSFNAEGIMSNGQIRISRGNGITGVINIKGEMVTPPLFIYGLSYQDPESKLSHAMLRKADGKYQEGYLNSDAVFVIIKKDSSVF